MSKRGHFSYTGHPPDTLVNEQGSRPRRRLTYRELLLDSGNFSSGTSDNPTFVFNKPISADYYSIESISLPLAYNYVSDQQFLAVRFIWEQINPGVGGLGSHPVFLTVKIGGPTYPGISTYPQLINYVQATIYNDAAGNPTVSGNNPVLFNSASNFGAATQTLNWNVYPNATVTALDSNQNFIWQDGDSQEVIVYNDSDAAANFTSALTYYPLVMMTQTLSNNGLGWSLLFHRMFLLTKGAAQLNGTAALVNPVTGSHMYDGSVYPTGLAGLRTDGGISSLNYMEIDFTNAPDLSKVFGATQNTVQRYFYAKFLYPPAGPMNKLFSGTTAAPQGYFQGPPAVTLDVDIAGKARNVRSTPAIDQTFNSTDILQTFGVPPNTYSTSPALNLTPDNYLLLRSNTLSGGDSVVALATASVGDLEKPSNIIGKILFPGLSSPSTSNVVFESDAPTIPECMTLFKGRVLDRIDLYWTNARTETGLTFNGYNFVVKIGLLSVELFD